MSDEITILHKPFMSYLKRVGLKFRRKSPKNHYKDSDDGVPDFEVLLKNKPVFIEFKTSEKYKLKGHDLRVKQKEFIDYLRSKCYTVLVTCSLQEAIDFIEERK